MYIWSNKKPRQEGYFWYRENGITEVVRVYTINPQGVLRATGHLVEGRDIKQLDGEWAGPLALPKELVQCVET